MKIKRRIKMKQVAEKVFESENIDDVINKISDKQDFKQLVESLHQKLVIQEEKNQELKEEIEKIKIDSQVKDIIFESTEIARLRNIVIEQEIKISRKNSSLRKKEKENFALNNLISQIVNSLTEKKSVSLEVREFFDDLYQMIFHFYNPV